MKKLILAMSALTLSMTFLSCSTIKKVVTRCTVDTDNVACYCHDYLLSNTGDAMRVGPTIKHEITKCDKLIGFPPRDWLEVQHIITAPSI